MTNSLNCQEKVFLLNYFKQKDCVYNKYFYANNSIGTVQINLRTTYIFSIRVFFRRHWRLTWQQEKGRDHFLFHSTTFIHSRTLRHLFAIFHARWLSHIFNCTACIYQAATQWDLPPYRISIWTIDDVKLVFFACLLDDLILGFCYSNLDTGN